VSQSDYDQRFFSDCNLIENFSLLKILPAHDDIVFHAPSVLLVMRSPDDPIPHLLNLV